MMKKVQNNLKINEKNKNNKTQVDVTGLKLVNGLIIVAHHESV